MPTQPEPDFVEWLEAELAARDWQPIDLARAGELYPATVSRILNRERRPGPDALTGIARGLRIPPETVFRRAGLLPEREETEPIPDDPELGNLLRLSRRLSAEDRRRMVEIARLFLRDSAAEE